MESTRRTTALSARIWLGAALALLAAAGMHTVSQAKEEKAPGAVVTTDKTLVAKLDSILENQQKIFQTLDEIKEQLRIIKIRASH